MITCTFTKLIPLIKQFKNLNLKQIADVVLKFNFRGTVYVCLATDSLNFENDVIIVQK